MVIRTFSVALAIATTALNQPAQAAPLNPQQKGELLAAQTRDRAALGVTPLVWSDRLATTAHGWAEHLAHHVGAMVHSGTVGSGENIAMWTAGRASLTHLVSLWGDERKHFIDAPFPNVSRTGNWRDVGHYTQIVWRNTKEVGCGLAAGGGRDFLVCQYYPQGNVTGQKTF